MKDVVDLTQALRRGKRLTHKQQAVLDFIVEHIEEEMRPPTIREIGQEFGMTSTNGPMEHLKALHRKGYIRRADRTIKVLHLSNGRKVAGVCFKTVEV